MRRKRSPKILPSRRKGHKPHPRPTARPAEQRRGPRALLKHSKKLSGASAGAAAGAAGGEADDCNYRQLGRSFAPAAPRGAPP